MALLPQDQPGGTKIMREGRVERVASALNRAGHRAADARARAGGPCEHDGNGRHERGDPAPQPLDHGLDLDRVSVEVEAARRHVNLVVVNSQPADKHVDDQETTAYEHEMEAATKQVKAAGLEVVFE